MEIHLTPELEALIEEKLRFGQYNSASDVVQEALRLMEYHERIRNEQFRAELDRRTKALDHGETVNGDGFFASIEAKSVVRRKEEIRQQVEEGWQASKRGEVVDGEEVFERIDAELGAVERSSR